MIKPKILLHICCAPCAIPILKILEKKNFLITGFWYNPNIWPKEEYEKRLGSLIQYEREKGLFIVYDYSCVPRAEPDSLTDRRCVFCYEDRLNKTAQKAEELDFDYFTTTLLVSPYQKHTMLRDMAEGVSQIFGVNFYYEDFRPFFYRYRKEAQGLGLYHQKYCGCKPSIEEAEETRRRQRLKKKG